MFSSWDSPFDILPYIVTAIAAFVSLFKFYLRLTCGKITTSRNMEGKTIIITGANSGIGKETARDLAKRGARIILACRNMDTAKQAREEIISEYPSANLILKHIDLSSLTSVRQFAQDIIATEAVIDVLIHNAGVAQGFNNKVTADGLEFTMATNCYGPFLLTHLLIDLLKKSDQGRIILVSSKLYRFARLRKDLSNINPINYFSLFPVELYNLSKFVEIMFTQELARRLKDTRVTANCLHPGVIDTGIWRNVPFPINLLFKPIQMCFRTPEEGARTTVFLTVSPDVANVSGKYFRGCKENELNQWVQDKDVQWKLWEAAKSLVKLRESDPKI
ncbi:retinol dehydrogenase 14 isoform X1 [Wyeomyia smithii]|uniref:retinol dehydrogenase 14 isoform X1 n=1 Tax=Wyeomyia smithii TaxID=174621 RepID=UPI002467AFD1|nr:retinol dehydrogenase 14 isoform X1 [Wyeomyia smithii]XP_055529808.1 retinol dehydrogenase 14 isoform X1 [Wyeomyia smithii]XP_055529809.1 retinol dehydrogenase 14 isoform X1 [Wyeomyia smithii]XP_055529810.1 retinol dehydrogenase 14 isoform X1 [Wyeomyia smithii]XP_055529811.1 retinol dehydrogenase 14 isoform X1 [Wyeomyia smithii]XP_055529812.1 retinol dehydrogenase 14 isoform X1 [Wyeomyia smithii]XP_055529813.1 retinol dehydrogenase 14 isoform X1 [Wyeomyia smithii]XP_055529814.1 retinol de